MDFLTTEVTIYKTGCLVNFLPCMAIYIWSRPESLWSDSLTIFYHVYDRSSEIECKILLLFESTLWQLRPSKPASITVSVRSGVFRHNRDSVGTRGFYRHNKTSLLAWTGGDTPVEDKVGVIKRLVTSSNKITYDLIPAIRWRWLCSNFTCNQIFQQSREWREICDTTSHI